MDNDLAEARETGNTRGEPRVRTCPPLISGYLGKSDAFALAYADQNERDHAAQVAAVKAGRIEALVEEDL